jgi:hypothetical protein
MTAFRSTLVAHPWRGRDPPGAGQPLRCQGPTESCLVETSTGVSVAAPSRTDLSAFWEILHAALGLQHAACQLAQTCQTEEAVLYERQALSLLLEATCLLDPDEPALSTVRMLATSGLVRLHELQRGTGASQPVPRQASPGSRRKSRALTNGVATTR